MLPVFAIIFLTAFHSRGQSDIRLVHQNLVWYRGFLECDLSNDWSVSLHVDERRYVFPDRSHQRLLPEIFVTKKLKSRSVLSGGLWWFNIFVPGDPFEPVSNQVREWRLYTSFARSYPLAKGAFRWRLEAEWRMFLSPGAANFFDGPPDLQVYRQRFLVGYKIPLKERWSLNISDELFLNLASNRGGVSFFDQNRVSVRFDHDITDHFSTTIGLLYWFQPTTRPGEYFSRYILEVGIRYHFALKEAVKG